MYRYSVSLPPITLMTPDCDATTACSRDKSAVRLCLLPMLLSSAAEVSINGRSPAYSPITSAGPSATSRAVLTVSSRNVTSSDVGCGTSGIGPGASSSVRPRYTRPSCSGIANTNRLISPGMGMVSAATGLPNALASNTR
jgi:hypothetical protein